MKVEEIKKEAEKIFPESHLAIKGDDVSVHISNKILNNNEITNICNIDCNKSMKRSGAGITITFN